MKMKTLLVLLVSAIIYVPFTSAELSEEVVVTGTRTPLAIDKLAASTTVITRADIDSLQVKSVPDLLTGIPGIDVTSSGGYGKTTGIRVRGTESDHALVLVDGVRIGSATLGTASFEQLPVAQIERIEIVRGPRSSIWGSEALGGVIHIFTRKGEGETPRYTLDIGGGSYETFEVTGGVSGEYKDFNYSGAVSYFDSEGFDARQPTTDFFSVDQPDKDGYDNISVHFRGGYSFGDIGQLEAFILHAEGRNEFDGSSEDKTDYTQQIVGGSLLLNLFDNWQTQLRLSQSHDKNDNLALDGSFSSRFNTQRQQLSWQNDVSILNDHGLTFGVDYREDEVDSTNTFSQVLRDNVGVYVQYNTNLYGHQIIASVRWDDDEVFGSETTGGIGWSYTWNDWLRMYASYGTAYKTPSFNELFFPGFGNPVLGPETSESYEAGLEGDYDWLRWSVRGYRNELDNLIVTVVNPAALFGFSPENVGRATVNGIEGEISLSWEEWNAVLAAEYLDPEDDATGARLPRRVKERFSLNLSRDIGQFSVGGRLLLEGDRFNNAGERDPVSGFATLDLRADYRFNDNITFRAKLANLLDKEYETIDTFNSKDRNFFLSVHYQSR